MKKIILIGLLIALPAICFGETIVLKSGKKIEGKILEKTDEYVKIEAEGVPLTFFNDEVQETQPVQSVPVGTSMPIPKEEPATVAIKRNDSIANSVISKLAEDYSADAIGTYGGRVSKGKIFVSKDKIRMEAEGGRVVITRLDKKVVLIPIPSSNKWMEAPYSSTHELTISGKSNDEIERKLMGQEMIDGRMTNKFQVVYYDKFRPEKQIMFQWFDADSNILVKAAAGDNSWTMEYKNIKIDKQPDELFEAPVKPSMPIPKEEPATVAIKQNDSTANSVSSKLDKVLDEEDALTRKYAQLLAKAQSREEFLPILENFQREDQKLMQEYTEEMQRNIGKLSREKIMDISRRMEKYVERMNAVSRSKPFATCPNASGQKNK